MSKGSLALLDHAVQEHIEYELGQEPKSLMTLRTRTVAGFEIPSIASRDAVYDARAAERLKKLRQYQTDRNKLTGSLQNFGITPVAVLPLVAWEQICDRTELYRFMPRGDKVHVDATALLVQASAYARTKKLRTFKIVRNVTWTVILCTILLCVLLSYHYDNLEAAETSPWARFAFLIVMFALYLGIPLTAMAHPCENDSTTEELKTTEADRIRQLVAEHEKKKTLHAALWPTLREPTSGLDIRIHLPVPPVDVQRQLITIERSHIPLHIAVVADAIGFKESVADALIGVRSGHWKKVELEEQLVLQRDPIGFVVEGSAVAVLFQYGEFPIEQEVIDEIISSDYLI